MPTLLTVRPVRCRGQESKSFACNHGPRSPGIRNAHGEYSSFPRTEMRLKIVIGIQNEILHGQSSGLFSDEPFEKKPVMTIEDFVWHSDHHFESHLLGNELYKCRFSFFLLLNVVVKLLLCRHTASPPITSGTVTGGVQL